MPGSRSLRLASGWTALAVALVVSACQAGSTSVPTPTTIPSVSLVPARETSTPEPVGIPVDLPPVPPPSGVAPPSSVPAPGAATDYVGDPDDLAAFVAAYRSAFDVPELTDQQIADAGARLGAYLQRQADATGAVDVRRALIEAEINEPGYPREVWILAFELASADYCDELSFDPDVEG